MKVIHLTPFARCWLFNIDVITEKVYYDTYIFIINPRCLTALAVYIL